MPYLIGNFPGGGGKPRKKAFADCTWEEISKVCKAGLASEYWQIGDIKPMVDGDISTQLRIIGFDHDDVHDPFTYGREKAGITLEHVFANTFLYGRMYKTTISVSWYDSTSEHHCYVRETLLPGYLSSKVPAELKNVIVPVVKEFYSRSNSRMSTVADELFIPSVNEIYGTYTSGFGSEGTQYAYYAAGNEKIKRLSTSGETIYQWTRSAEAQAYNCFSRITPTGLKDISGTDSYGYAIACMCI